MMVRKTNGLLYTRHCDHRNIQWLGDPMLEMQCDDCGMFFNDMEGWFRDL